MLRSKLLREIYQQPALSRADLTRTTGASSASVTQIIRDLIREGVVVEQGREQEGLGRPRVMLSIDPQFRHVIGLRMVSSVVQGCVINLRGESRCTLERQLPSFEVEDVLDVLQGLVQDLLIQAGLTAEHILGVGLALSGIVDVQKHTCVYSFLLGWKNVPIARMLQERLLVPVVVDNDVNAITLGQKLFGEARDQQYFAVLYLGEGIGAGFYHQDRMLTGQNNAAGEIGHFTVVRNGRPCICGKRGCLQAYASSGTLVQQAQEHGLDVQNLQDLRHLAEQQDPEALHLLGFAGQLVGLALSYVMDTLDLSRVLVYAGTLSEVPVFQDALRTAVKYHSLPLVNHPRELVFRPPQEDLWLSGAAGILIHAFLHEAIPAPMLTRPMRPPFETALKDMT